MAKEKDKTNSNLTAGLVGAAVGAAVGASAVVLSDKDNREKLAKGISDLKERTEDKLKDVSEDSKELGQDTQDKLHDQLTDMGEDAEDLGEEVKDKVDDYS